MVFGRESPPRSDFGVALGLRGEVIEEDSLKSKDFLIISYRDIISFSCLAWIATTAMATTNVTALVIDC